MIKFSFFSIFITLSTNDSFKLLKQLSAFLPIPPEFYLGNAKASDDNAKAELFNEFLSSVYQEEWFKFTPASNDENCDFYLNELSFSTIYIEELLIKLPESSYPAADNIPPFILKTGASIIAYFAFILFNLIAITLTWPVSWKNAYKTPLQKSASKADIENYRGISISPRILLEREKKSYNFIYDKNFQKLSDCQYGFRSRRSSLRCCLIMLISSIILRIKMKILGVYILILIKHSTVFHATDYFLN